MKNLQKNNETNKKNMNMDMNRITTFNSLLLPFEYFTLDKRIC